MMKVALPIAAGVAAAAFAQSSLQTQLAALPVPAEVSAGLIGIAAGMLVGHFLK